MSRLPKYCSRNKNQLGNKYVRFKKGKFSTYLTDKPDSEEFMRQYANALKGIKRPRWRIVDNFWTYVDKRGPTDCWPWTRQIDREGYGRAQSKDDVLAHRHAWKLSKGPIPKGLHVLHRCDNPACCNPKHLWIGTHQDNMNDRQKKGRWKDHWNM